MTPPQSWDPERYAPNARFVSGFGLPLLELLRPKARERNLDLGCGDGVLTERLAAIGCEMIGVDSSPEQVAAARARGLDARLADGQTLAFEREFDGVFSNAALHWMPRTDDVIAGVWRALKPGGRFVAECGGAGNIAWQTGSSPLPSPFSTRYRPRISLGWSRRSGPRCVHFSATRRGPGW